MRIRTDKDSNYKAVFFNGKTIRMRLDQNLPITSPKYAEIEDVAINNKCFGSCSYCYTSALKSGTNFPDPVEKANSVWGSRELKNDRPFQIAIGGAGESTLHPDWVKFVKAVSSLDIVPNYTTNGMHLTEEVLRATEDYCGGVALSFHPHLEKFFHPGIDKLKQLKTTLNIHVIIGDENSLVKVKELFNLYKDVVNYFVLLPYQAAGRGKVLEVENNWISLFLWLDSLSKEEQKKFAFGALFYPFLLNNEFKLDIDIYEPEIYSGYRIFDDSYMKLRVSSYNPTFKKE